MNLVSGSIENGVFTSDGIRIEGLPHRASGAVTLGFRAEDATLAEANGQIEAPIYTVELLGEATMLSMRVAGELVSIKVGKDYRAEIGELARIAIPASACHIFDQSTGARIEA
jgi:multiple sugar transport system ATP-binding protein